MLGKTHYQDIRQIYFSRLAQQTSEVLIEKSSIVEIDDYSNFIGENKVIWNDNTLFKCLYIITDTPAEREKYGVSDDTNIVFYLSDIELINKTGINTFSEEILRTKSGIRINFNKRLYIAEIIKEVEPNSFDILIGIEFHCKEVT